MSKKTTISIIILVLFVANEAQAAKDGYIFNRLAHVEYGSGKDQIGLLDVPDIQRSGPESFSVDAQGEIYICDTVNQRIQIFSPNGEYQSTIPLEKEITASDIAIDRVGLIYVYDAKGRLYQYDKKGNLVSTINVDTNRWQVRMGMHIVNDNIYISSVDQDDVLIGKIAKGLLVAPTAEALSQPLEKGIHGFSGRRYYVKLLRWEKGEIEIFDRTGVTPKSIELQINGIVSIRFLQEDRKGNFYIQTERIGEGIILEVHKFDSSGDYLTVIPIPDTDYHSWSIKLLSLDENGNIYQFLPARERGRLNIFRQE